MKSGYKLSLKLILNLFIFYNNFSRIWNEFLPLNTFQEYSMQQSRENWGSKIGFILAAAGSAIGLGNIWRFPYVLGENGGAAFLFVYLICIGVIGLPVLIGEILIGRTGKRDPVGSFKALTKSKFWPYIVLNFL